MLPPLLATCPSGAVTGASWKLATTAFSSAVGIPKSGCAGCAPTSPALCTSPVGMAPANADSAGCLALQNTQSSATLGMSFSQPTHFFFISPCRPTP